MCKCEVTIRENVNTCTIFVGILNLLTYLIHLSNIGNTNVYKLGAFQTGNSSHDLTYKFYQNDISIQLLLCFRCKPCHTNDVSIQLLFSVAPPCHALDISIQLLFSVSDVSHAPPLPLPRYLYTAFILCFSCKPCPPCHTHDISIQLLFSVSDVSHATPLQHPCHAHDDSVQLLLGHRSQRLQWSWPIVITRCPASVRRLSSVRLFTFSTSSPEPLDGFWWNLVWMKYSRSLTSVVVFRPDPSRGGSRAGQK